jgi:uncharacterized protein (TIGR02678 family)
MSMDTTELNADSSSSEATTSRRAWAPEASLEAAAALRRLAARPWLVTDRDDDAIAAVRRNLAAVRAALTRLGWVLVLERDLVRLRKTPPSRRAAYAATGPSPLTCAWFFLLVAAAEAMPRRIGIGQLVAAARQAAAEADVPVTGELSERRAIVGALRMLDDRGVVQKLDGDLEGFVHDEHAPVLLAVHHTRLLHVIANFVATESGAESPADPVADPEAWLELIEREPNAALRMRRRLVDDTVVHAVDLDDAEANWLSRRVRGDDGGPLAESFGLHLERRTEGAAFVVPEGAFRHPHELGPLPFPAPGTVAHAALLLCGVAAKIGSDDGGPGSGWKGVGEKAVADALDALAAEHSSGWRRELTESPRARLLEEVRDLLLGNDLARLADDSLTWWFSPVTGRWSPPIETPIDDNAGHALVADEMGST